MCISLRLITKAINNRINPLLQNLINEQQRANVPTRRMDHGVTLLTHLIHRSTLNPNSTTALLQVDFKQAFDNVSHFFLRRVLEAVGFGPRMIQTIMTITTTLQAQIIVNDLLSPSYKVKRGVPQGCALSAVLFILCLEPLLRYTTKLKYAKDGVDLTYSSVPNLLWYLAYADDLQIPFTSFKQLKVWLQTLSMFAKFSGLECNWLKTKIHLIGRALWVPPLPTSTVPTLSVKGFSLVEHVQRTFPSFTKDSFSVIGDFKYCGVLFSIRDELRLVLPLMNREDAPLECNLTSRSWNLRVSSLERFTGTLKKTPVPSFSKRISFALTHVLSKIHFLAFTSTCPPSLISRLQTMINQLVFHKSVCPTDIRIAMMPTLHLGGFDHVNVQMRFAALTATWVQQYIKNSLPSMLHSLITEGLKAYLLYPAPRAPPRVPKEIVDAIPHPTALVDAVIQSMSKDLKFNLERTTFDGNPNSTSMLPPIFRQALIYLCFSYHSSNNSSVIPRQFQPPETDSPDPTVSLAFLNEPLFLNSSICLRIDGSCLLIPEEALPIHRTGLRSVRDLMLTPTYEIQPYQRVMAQDIDRREIALSLDSPRYPSLRSLVGPVGQRWRFLLPRQNISSCQDTNDLWSSILPKEPLNLLLSQSNLQPQIPLPLQQEAQNTSATVCWTNNSVYTSHYPIQIPIPPITCEETSENSLVPILSMSTKQYGIVFKRVAYMKFKSDTKSALAVVPTPFRENHGWPKQLGISSLSVPWNIIVDALVDKAIPESSHYYCMSFVYFPLWCPTVYKMPPNTPPFVFQDGSTSSWTCCPRCSQEYTPLHAAFYCSELTLFWANIHRVLLPLIPDSALVPRAKIGITQGDIPCCGLSLLVDPKKSCSSRHLLINVFACAFKALFSTISQPDFNKQLLTQQEKGKFQSYAFSQFTSAWCNHLRTCCAHLRSGGKKPAVPFPHTVVVSSNLDILFSKINNGTAPVDPKEIERRRVEMVHQYFPYLTLDPDPLLVDQVPLSDVNSKLIVDPHQLVSVHVSNLQITAPSAVWPPNNFRRVLPPYATALSSSTSTTSSAVNQGSAIAPLPPSPIFPQHILPNVDLVLVPIFTDGSCRNNGRPSAKAGYAVLCPSYPQLDLCERLPYMFTQSNNAAELMAIIKALQRSVSLQPLLQKLVIPHICTDSQYVIQSVLSHIPAWKLSLPPDPHEPNALLIQELGILSRQHTIIWQHVRAHTTADDFFSYYNRVVDKQANKITIDPPAGTPHV